MRFAGISNHSVCLVTASYETCVLFADVSGFTALTEALSVKGPEGAEALAKHVCTANCFIKFNFLIFDDSGCLRNLERFGVLCVLIGCVYHGS